MGSNAKEGDLTLYIYKLNKKNEIITKDSVLLNQRIRDLHVVDDSLFLFLESTGTIAVFDLKKLN